MTNDEAVNKLKYIRRIYPSKNIENVEADVALDMAIKALEQEPCEDAISRRAVIDMTGLSEWFDSSDSYNEFVIALSELPPVTPQAESEDKE